MEEMLAFELEEESGKKASEWVTAEEFKAEIHSEGWFEECEEGRALDPRELHMQRAAAAFYSGDFQRAFEELQTAESVGEHKGCHRFQLRDALLQTALRLPSPSPRFLLPLLSSHREAICNFGDQLSHVLLSCRVYSALGDDARLLGSAALLCSLTDLPEDWLRFMEISSEKQGPHLHLFCLLRCLQLAEQQLPLAKGFVREKMERDVVRWEEELERDFEADKVAEARKELERSRKWEKKGVEGEGGRGGRGRPPVHDCRSRQRLLKEEERREAVEVFFSRQKFMLEGMETLIQEATLAFT